MAYAEFAPVFAATNATDCKAAYAPLAAAHNLPKWSSRSAAEDALRAYEDEHPQLLSPIRSSDQAYGAEGPFSRLRERSMGICAAVKDAVEERTEAKQTASLCCWNACSDPASKLIKAKRN